MIKVSMNQESASSHPAYLKGADLSIRAFQNFRKGVKAFFKDKEPRYDGRQFFMTLQTSQMTIFYSVTSIINVDNLHSIKTCDYIVRYCYFHKRLVWPIDKFRKMGVPGNISVRESVPLAP